MSSTAHSEPDPVGTKLRAKRLLQRVLPGQDLPPLIVASIGRSGSTLVYDALRKSMAARRFPRMSPDRALKLVSDTAWDLATTQFLPGVVYKTHGLAGEIDPHCNAKVIFIFDRASDVALSVLACQDRFGEDWIEEHLRHLRATGDLSDLMERDVLRIREQIDGWVGRNGIARLVLHFDALWDETDALSAFAGVPVTLPPYRPRNSSDGADAETLARLRSAYGPLDDYIAGLPRIQVLS